MVETLPAPTPPAPSAAATALAVVRFPTRPRLCWAVSVVVVVVLAVAAVVMGVEEPHEHPWRTLARPGRCFTAGARPRGSIHRCCTISISPRKVSVTGPAGAHRRRLLRAACIYTVCVCVCVCCTEGKSVRVEAATIVVLIVCVPFYLFPPSDGKCFRSAASNLLPNEVPKCRVKCSTLTADQTSTDSTDGTVLDREETDDSSIASLLASVERNEKLLSSEDGTDQSSSSCTMVAVVSSDKPFLYLTKHICVALCAPRRNLSSHFF